MDYFAVSELGKNPTDRPGVGSFVEGERLYYLYGWIQFQRLEAELKHGDEDGDDGPSGTQPGQGTPTEREMWQDPERIDEIQYQ